MDGLVNNNLPLVSKQTEPNNNHSANSLITGFLLNIILLLYSLYVGLKSKNPVIKLFALWLLFGSVCLLTNGKLLLTRPSINWLAYWIPFAFIVFSDETATFLKRWEEPSS